MLSILAEMVGCDKTKVPNLVQCLRQLQTGKLLGDLSHPRPFDATFIPKMFPLMPVCCRESVMFRCQPCRLSSVGSCDRRLQDGLERPAADCALSSTALLC